ncbi:MAG: hypothetical protein QF473_34875 [Planctomycetota bacterium]|nr:hypothetical protein [Planctomycetota bacterium]
MRLQYFRRAGVDDGVGKPFACRFDVHYPYDGAAEISEPDRTVGL